jgi:hypothetical protein
MIYESLAIPRLAFRYNSFQMLILASLVGLGWKLRLD